MRTSVLLGIAAAIFVLGAAAIYFVMEGIGGGRIGRSPVAIQMIPPPPAAPPGAPPVAPVDYQPLTPQSAMEINNTIPLMSVGPAAKPFSIAMGTPTWDRAVFCLAQAIFYEAGAESRDGQRAVAQVVLNRVRSPAFPNSICGVVYQGSDRPTGCQFTFTCDGSLKRTPSAAGWRRAVAVATSALQGSVYAPVGNATHYHANYVVPYWASSMAKVQVVGAHDFYRWPGTWRAAAYFSQPYANLEPQQAVPAVAPLPLPAEAVAAAPPLPPRLAADITPSPYAKSGVAPAIDGRPHTLIPGQNAPSLDPSLNRVVVLEADRQRGKLEPTPSMRVRDR